MAISYKKSWVLCLSGAHHAINRINEALERGAPDSQVINPLAEALWWICATDESLSEEYPSEWRIHLRPNLTNLDLLKGLRWARNRVTHQICHWELAKPPFLWAEAEIVAPTGSIPRGKDHGRAEYIANLEGKSPQETISLVLKEIKRVATASLPPEH